MSNIEAARAALQAELDHAKAGHAFYSDRIASIENALAQLVGLSGAQNGRMAVGPTMKAKRGRKPGAVKLATADHSGGDVAAVTSAKVAKTAKLTKVRGTKAAKGAEAAKVGKRGRPRKAATNGNDLPFTGGDYWTNLVSDTPQSASEILASAIAKLGFEPDKIQRQKLQSRMIFALNALVKDKKIADSGKGRERRYFNH